MTARMGIRFGVLLLAAAFMAPAFGATDHLYGGHVTRTATKSKYRRNKLSPEKQRILDQLPEGNPRQRKSIQKHLQVLQDRERIAKRVADRQQKAIEKDADRRFQQSQRDEKKHRSSRGNSTRSRR